MRRGSLCVPLVVCAASACGEGLVAGTTYDQVLFAFSGTIRPTGGIGNARDRTETMSARHPVVSLFWTDPLQRNADLPAPAHTIRSSVSPLDDRFSVEIFRPPPAAALVDIVAPSGETATLALAEIVVIDDADGDGTFRVTGPRAEIGAPDLYLGGSANVLVYVSHPYPSPQAFLPLTSTGATGYELVSYLCTGPISAGVEHIPSDAADLVLRPSVIFPEVRTCKRSHSP